MRKAYIFVTILVALIIILSAFLLNSSISNKNIYSFSGESFSYSQDRGQVNANISLEYVNDTLDYYLVNYPSRPLLNYSTTIYGLLVMPSNASNVPGLVLLPGGGVKKEDELRLASIIAHLGYAVLTIDQRGIGQTGGFYLSPDQDYPIFSEGKEPMQHLAVFDALRAFDVLRSMPQVNESDIAMSGESMGGRYAIIATALDSRIKGFIGISTSGFHFSPYENSPYTPYLVSIDPDNYISKISPRQVFMIHSSNDSIIPLSDAETTYSLAGQPKNLTIINSCGHGYCTAMLPALKADLSQLLGH